MSEVDPETGEVVADELLADETMDDLLTRYGGLLDALDTVRDSMTEIEAELLARCRADMVTEYKHAGVVVSLKDKPKWDYQILDGLHEVIPPDEVELYQTKPKEPEWSPRALKVLARAGGDVAKIVAQAQGKAPEVKVRRA